MRMSTDAAGVEWVRVWMHTRMKVPVTDEATGKQGMLGGRVRVAGERSVEKEEWES